MTARASFLFALTLGFFGLFGLSALTGCEPADEESEILRLDGIVNGVETSYSTWRGVVGLKFYTDNFISICTGTLIDPEVVLTAGHCVYLPEDGVDAVANPSQLAIVGGATMDIVYTTAAKVTKHSLWSGDINDQLSVDLAMVRLQSPILTVETYPIVKTAPVKGTMGKIVGY
jgi:V8-like Glu-specific endopeptidase